MKTIQNTIRQLRYQKLVTGLLLAAFYRLLLEGRIIRRVSLIDHQQKVPEKGFPPERIITENSEEWRLIYDAVKQADEDISRWWSPRSGEVLAYWYANSEYMFVFYSTQGDSGVYAGVTDIEFGNYLNLPFGTQQAVHLSLRDQQGKPTEIQDLAETIIHEAVHVREARHGMLEDQNELEEILRQHILSENFEPWFHQALISEMETLPWTIAKFTSDKNPKAIQRRRKRYRSIVKWLKSRENIIFPEEPTNRIDQQQTKETT